MIQKEIRQKLVLLLIVSLIVISETILVTAADKNYALVDTLASEFSLGSTISIGKSSSDSLVKKVSAEVSFYPRSDVHQQGSFVVLEPDAVNINDNIKFVWENPVADELSFKLINRVKTENEFVKVKTKVAYPYAVVLEDAEKYLAETALMDFSNPAIKAQASAVAQGEDDAYVIAHKLAVWVGENVNYSLSTLTAEASLQASWVLENKLGVCDEITNLYIAMLRSLGIPAKFVVGMSYTTSDLFSENWGAHGWAEVYFPGYGWVPFDITYNQLGYVDATHIKLKEAVDSSKTGTKYEWEGRDIALQVQKLDLTVKVLSSGKKITDRLALTAEILHPDVGFGSYNVLLVTVKNPNNFYVPTQLYLSRTENLEILDNQPRAVLLKPFEEKTLYYKVKVSEQLQPKFVYTFFIVAYTQLQENATIAFTTTQGEDAYSFKDVDEYIQKKLPIAEQKSYSQNIQLGCVAEKEQYSFDEEKLIRCSIANKGNTIENNVYVCLQQNCERVNLKMNEQKELLFPVADQKLGITEYTITAKSSSVDIKDIISISVVDKPKIVVMQKDFQAEQRLSDPVLLAFTINKDSLAVPKDVAVAVNYGKLSKDWHFEAVENQLTFKLQLQPYELQNKQNQFYLTITYKDNQGQNYVLQDSVIITLKDLSLKDTVILYGNKLLYSPEKLYIILLVLLLVVVVLLLALFFRKRKKK